MAKSASIFTFLASILLVQTLTKLEAKNKVPAIIVFGDFFVDSGNKDHISTVIKSDFPSYGRDFEDGKATGRFSNGKIATDFISEAFRIKATIPAYLDPAYNIIDFATGLCFAYNIRLMVVILKMERPLEDGKSMSRWKMEEANHVGHPWSEGCT